MHYLIKVCCNGGGDNRSENMKTSEKKTKQKNK